MHSLIDPILVAVLLLNLFALGNSRITTVIRVIGVQGGLLGVLPLLVHEYVGLLPFVVSAATVTLKGIVIPFMLLRAMREAQIRREVEPSVGFLPSMILGALSIGFSVVLAQELPMAKAHLGLLLVPASLSTVLVGFIMLTTRYKAISQVVGYLILENGIFIFGMLLVEAMPLMVELGVLLDLFVGIFVITIIVNHINEAFSSLDTRKLSSLKE
ncbi:MAG TPA: hydrogenase [Planctomycetota bacterium]|nr:hydrogenase [Planctomycetota bacterium]